MAAGGKPILLEARVRKEALPAGQPAHLREAWMLQEHAGASLRGRAQQQQATERQGIPEVGLGVAAVEAKRLLAGAHAG
eukprot:14916455-Alexandrium_andersonii.AAC.1